MKIKYSKEENPTATVCVVVCLILTGLAIWNLTVGELDKPQLSASLFMFGIAAFILFASRFAAKEVKAHKKERERMLNEGNCISGQVVELIEKRNASSHSNKRYSRYLKVSCFSTMLNREVTFETPALHSEFEEYEGLTCTVYEACENPDYPPKLNIKPMLSVQDSNGNVMKHVPSNVVDGVAFCADELENAEKKKTKLSDVLWVVFVIAFFVTAGYFCTKQ
ncbi:MAG: hypothetical protein J6K17_05525 [Oscillospiraceae bacterium]|nr:hypothetical protein [Oscillospiraceae bacterium]